MLKALFRLPSVVWLLGLFNDSASELVYPLMPLYLALPTAHISQKRSVVAAIIRPEPGKATF